MGKQLKTKKVFFKTPLKPNNDTLDWENFLVAVIQNIPLFFYWPVAMPIPTNIDTRDTSADNAYYDLKAARAREPLPGSEYAEEEMNTEVYLAIADRDINWSEYDELDQFEVLDTLKIDYVIVVLKSSIMVIDYSWPPGEDERQILEGFDLQDPKLPAASIHCHSQLPS